MSSFARILRGFLSETFSWFWTIDDSKYWCTLTWSVAGASPCFTSNSVREFIWTSCCVDGGLFKMDRCSPRVRRLLARLMPEIDFCFDNATDYSASPSSKSDSRLLFASMKSLTPTFASLIMPD